MKKFYGITLIVVVLLSLYYVDAVEQITLPQTNPEVIRSVLLSGTTIELNNSGEVINNESGSSISGEVNNNTEGKNENQNSPLQLFTTIIEAGILVYMVSKTFQYISESGKTFSNITIQKEKYCKELPFDEITPGQAEFLKDVNLASEGNIFAASLLNMKMKGAIKFGYIGNERLYENAVIKLVKEEDTPLIAEEKIIYDFLTAYARKFQKEDGSISLYMLQKYMENNKERIGKLKKFIEESVKESIESYDVRADKRVKKRAVDVVIYIAILVIMLIIHSCHFNIFSIYTWIYFISIINIAFCIGIVLKTKIFGSEGAINGEKLKGFERYLKDFAATKEQGLPEIAIWEYYIIFAVAFGIAPNVLKQIRACYPNMEDSSFMETYEYCEHVLKCDFKSKFLFAK